MVVYGGIAISIIAVIVVLFFLINFLINDNSGGQPIVYPSSTPTPGPTIVNGTIIPSKPPVNNLAKIALKIDGDPTHGGSLWLMNYDKSDMSQVIKDNVIDTIYSWSPDNHYLALTVIQTQNSVSKRFVAVYDSASLGLLKSSIEVQVNDQVFWESDTNLIAVQTLNNTKKIYSLTLPELNYNVTSISIDSAVTSTIQVSNDLKWAFASLSSDLSMNSLLIYNINTQTKYMLKDLNLITENEFSPVMWSPDNKFIYYTHEGFFELDPNNLQASQLFSLHTNLTDAKPGQTIRYNLDQSNMYFFIGTQVYRYSFKSLTTKELFDINALSLRSSDLDNFWISPSEKYLTLTAGVNPSYLVNLDNQKTIQLCELTCYDPVWQN
jgi:hypothetical protein